MDGADDAEIGGMPHMLCKRRQAQRARGCGPGSETTSTNEAAQASSFWASNGMDRKNYKLIPEHRGDRLKTPSGQKGETVR